MISYPKKGEDPDDAQRSNSRSLSSPFRVGSSSQSNGFGADVLKLEAQLRRQHQQQEAQQRSAPAMPESSGRDTDDDDVDEDDEEEVEMVDHACQTRESLFDDDPTAVPGTSSK